MATSERPRPEPRARRRPQAAADDGVDPIVPNAPRPIEPREPTAVPSSRLTDRGTNSASAPAVSVIAELPVRVPRRRRGEPTVQLNVRQPPEVAEMISAVVEATGASKAEVVEAAIRAAYQRS